MSLFVVKDISCHSCSPGALTGAEKDGIKTISVMKGDSVTLPTGVSEINRYMQILWLFGPENPDTLVAEIYKTSISIYDSYKGLDRLQMDQQTGSLTIRNITTTHSGLYTAQIMTAMVTNKRFKVIVYGEFKSFFLCRPTAIFEQNVSK